MAALNVVVRLQFEGVHSWPDVPSDVEESYLKYPHRHVFHVEAVKSVSHVERDVEIIALKRSMVGYCEQHFGMAVAGWHTLSCEAMALKLLEVYDLKSCRVLEDNENGAEVTA